MFLTIVVVLLLRFQVSHSISLLIIAFLQKEFRFHFINFFCNHSNPQRYLRCTDSFQKKYLNVFHINSTLMHAAAHVVYVFPLYLSYLYVAAHDQIKLGFEVVKNHCSVQTSGRLGSIIITRSALSSLPSRSRWLRWWWSDRVKSRNYNSFLK